ncbi:MAG: hypothetical protein L6V93_20480 [Clostridiales bacterium]|nr:MAG: hypothetical protein L6V93_20480 [Clostridiales bacterium]
MRNDFMNISDIIKTDVLVFGGGIAGVKSAYTAVNNGCSAVFGYQKARIVRQTIF